MPLYDIIVIGIIMKKIEEIHYLFPLLCMYVLALRQFGPKAQLADLTAEDSGKQPVY